ncbi:MAG: LacI family DNA-binding transcriptional regulator [Corynebacterium sp.]|nr:LacI family DNA-binding transcriptional regulator [Corynebacterium sp.]
MPGSVNLKAVAAAAGVSISTASRALAGKTTISAATRKRVEQAAQKLNYQPNIQARGLRTARTYTIGLAIPTLINPFFATMAAAIQDQAARYGLTTIITSYSEQPAQLAQAVSSLRQHKVDGMIVVPHPEVANHLRNIAQGGTPVVLLDRELPGTTLTTVTSNPLPGITAAIEHLVAQGHHRIGYLAGPRTLSTGQSRLKAFRAACELNGTSPDYVYPGGFEVEEGIAGTQELLSRNITALIAGDSMMTLGAMMYCHDNGVDIGKDIALVGFDDLVYMQVQPSPISVVDQNVVELGHTAVEQLHSALNSLHSPPQSADNAQGIPPGAVIRIPTHFIPRKSSLCPPSGQVSSNNERSLK